MPFQTQPMGNEVKCAAIQHYVICSFSLYTITCCPYNIAVLQHVSCNVFIYEIAWNLVYIKKYFLSNDIIINSQAIIFVASIFYIEYFVRENERLSHCCKSDEILGLCVQFENSNLQHFKF